MEFLGIGPLEVLVILLIALVAVGPRDLGKAARSTGRLLNRLYRSEAWGTLTDASRNIRALPNRLAREAALEELEQTRREMQQGLTDGLDKLKSDFIPPESGASENEIESPTEPTGTSKETSSSNQESA